MVPSTFIVGVTQPDIDGLKSYCEATNRIEFFWHLQGYLDDHRDDPMPLVSFFAKLCYKSFKLGDNSNVSRIRDIEDNITSCYKQGHGSIFEHVSVNFVTTGCSRIFTHELVRHRPGMAYSQTSGRFCTVEDAELVLPPEMEDTLMWPGSDEATVAEVFRRHLNNTKMLAADARAALKLDEKKPCPECPTVETRLGCKLCGGTGFVFAMPFDKRKKWTSALRRIMPNGADNEIGWTANVRSLRHLIEMRTSRSAEWEIRKVFHDVYYLVADRWPLMLHGAQVEVVDDLVEVKGLKV